MKERFYKYLKNYLEEYDDPRKGDESFIHGRANYAANVFEAEKRAGTIAPYEVAIYILMEGLEKETDQDDEDNG